MFQVRSARPRFSALKMLGMYVNSPPESRSKQNEPLVLCKNFTSEVTAKKGELSGEKRFLSSVLQVTLSPDEVTGKQFGGMN